MPLLWRLPKVLTNTGNYECGVRALRFANDHYDFRYGANRIYVNRTDEPNQPNGEEYFSGEQIHPDWKWNSNDGTIHTVYSASSKFKNGLYHTEHPWLRSDNTGGSNMLDVDQNYTGVNLSDFPVTGALRNAYRGTSGLPHQQGMRQRPIMLRSPSFLKTAQLRLLKNMRLSGRIYNYALIKRPSDGRSFYFIHVPETKTK